MHAAAGLVWRLALPSPASVENHSQCHREGDNRNHDRGKRVHVWLHTQANAREDLNRQGRRSRAVHKLRDYRVFKAKRKGQQPARDQRRSNQRHYDAKEHVDGFGAQVSRCLNHTIVQVSQSRLHDD